jgi:glucose/arabinose dehydrogenase
MKTRFVTVLKGGAAAAMSLCVLAACEETTGPSDDTGIAEICDADDGGLDLPSGFCAVVVHDVETPGGEPAEARHLVVLPSGDIFVAVQSEGGGVLALRDTNGDGKADQTATFGSAPGHGIAYQAPYLYFAPDDRVERYRMGSGLMPESGPEVIVSGMPDDGDHPTKSIAVTADGTLYVNLGSASDVCQVENREPGSLGVDPCPELPIRSGIWRYNANQVGQTHSTAARFATGTRNMVALALHPSNGGLYGIQHGRDNLNEYWPDMFSVADQSELPDEEFFRLEAAADYGWPYCYYDGRQDRKVLGPEYGGDGETVGRCAAAEDPLATYPAHWAPNGIVFYDGDMFPETYSGGVFIAFHGGHNRRDPFENEGFNVHFVRFAGGAPVGSSEVFADGFVGPNAVDLPGDAAHRPVGVAVGPDGSLYISDDRGGRIWRVVYSND